MRVLNYGFSSDIPCRYEPPELMKRNRLTEHSYAMKNASEDVRCMAQPQRCNEDFTGPDIGLNQKGSKAPTCGRTLRFVNFTSSLLSNPMVASHPMKTLRLSPNL